MCSVFCCLLSVLAAISVELRWRCSHVFLPRAANNWWITARTAFARMRAVLWRTRVEFAASLLFTVTLRQNTLTWTPPVARDLCAPALDLYQSLLSALCFCFFWLYFYKKLEKLHPSTHSSVHPLSIHPPTPPSTAHSACIQLVGTQCKKHRQEQTGLLLAYVPTQETRLDLRGASRSTKCSRKRHQVHPSSLNFMILRWSAFRKRCVCSSFPI